MNIENDIQKIILFEKKYILRQLDLLKKDLGLEKKFNTTIAFIDDMDSIYLTNLDLKSKDLFSEIKTNGEKKLEMRCHINGEKKYIKSFGQINQIPIKTLIQIIKFINLVKLLKSMSDASYYASQYHMANTLNGNLDLDD